MAETIQARKHIPDPSVRFDQFFERIDRTDCNLRILVDPQRVREGGFLTISISLTGAQIHER